MRDAGLELLCISQFTLYCQLKGNKPDYRRAMGGEEAQQLYQQLVDRLRSEYSQDKVKGERGLPLLILICGTFICSVRLERLVRKWSETRSLRSPRAQNVSRL